MGTAGWRMQQLEVMVKRCRFKVESRKQPSLQLSTGSVIVELVREKWKTDRLSSLLLRKEKKQTMSSESETATARKTQKQIEVAVSVANHFHFQRCIIVKPAFWKLFFL